MGPEGDNFAHIRTTPPALLKIPRHLKGILKDRREGDEDRTGRKEEKQFRAATEPALKGRTRDYFFAKGFYSRTQIDAQLLSLAFIEC